MQAKHTPGPWQVSGVRVKLGNEDCQAVGPDNFTIAFLPIGRRPHELAGALADARLLAAAPDMLEALRNTLSLLKVFTRETDDVAKTVWDQAEAAIAKATGAA